ncbi:hypothetical protein, partial [Anaerotruncus massiliensis (ex Togo et al. 2019)]|uniref:hypothetical protein n=1 Tax=Anaerotruncus massiliensis (ex Togo et al. 2019) TaxID=1673720 RepID=UPI0023F1D58F
RTKNILLGIPPISYRVPFETDPFFPFMPKKANPGPIFDRSRVRFFAGSDLGIFCDLRPKAIPLLIFQELGGITVGAFQPAQ